jgi:hypothetical protein
MSLRNLIDKSPMQSKKFIAYFVTNILNKALLFFMIIHSVNPSIIVWGITASAFIDIGYIIGQAALDGFVRIAHIQNPFYETDEEKTNSTSDQKNQ